MRPYSSLTDAFVARLDGDGNLIWNTFLGGNGNDNSNDIATDSLGNVYVIGSSSRGWSCDTTPPSCLVSPYVAEDAFVAKLGPNGSLLWNTFLGGPGTDEGYGIVVDAADRLFVTGTSKSSWGTPIRAYCGEGDETRQGDAFVARLDVSGNLLWNTFLGSKYPDEGYAIDTDREGGVYVAGCSALTWGDTDLWMTDSAFASELDSSGAILWTSFFGSTGDDVALGISANDRDHIVIAGRSGSAWGSPILPFPGNGSVFVARLLPFDSTVWMPWSQISK